MNNTQHITKCALAGLAAVSFGVASGAQAAYSPNLLEKMDLLYPGEGAPAYKVKANQKYGTQWHVDAAYGFYNVHHSVLDEKNTNVHAALIHGHLNQRLINDEENGGTWLHVEFIGSWGLCKDSVDAMKNSLVGAVTSPHRDIVGARNFYFPEVSIKHFFYGKRAAIIGGMVKFGDYFDSVGIAGDTYTSFANSGFCNSVVLPLTDSNLGGIVQVQVTPNNYVMAGVTRTGTQPGYDPFNSDNNTGYVVMGEWGHYFKEGKGVVKLTPFFCVLEHVLERNHRNAGIVGSVQYSINDRLTVFARGGGSVAKHPYGNGAELTAGLRAKLISSRKDDYFGLAGGVFKGINPTEWYGDEIPYHNREIVTEAYYNLQLSKHFSIMPRVQYIHNPAYSGRSDATVAGVQTVFNF